ncbi:MAG: bifunctional heptose 7-phosphate kinase/heptose 1-phosphate adenyltransferase [Planctomycetales bacterium]|nr:bifunctional heptose 7-phosphate kinase/heptose 1-phosphate adenyltransferase [Planctomycetales bacterium]
MLHDLTTRIDELRGRHVLVLGDLILDRYTWGNAERVSPEAPVLVLSADEHEVRPGGAASVAVLLRHLEAKVMLAGVVGDDAAGRSLTKILDDEQINHDLVCCVPGRPTTTKERFVGRASNRHPHQILRVDHETRETIDSETVTQLRDGILGRMAGHGVIVISDYAKGVCTPELLNAIIEMAHTYRIPVVVDPARISEYNRYRRASLVTPNRSEAELATGIRIESPADALAAGRQLVEQASIGAAFITIDRDGIAAVGGPLADDRQHVEPAAARDVYDITGAGDMVIAIAGLCQAAGWPLIETAQLSNTAAGLEIEQLGITPVTWDQIIDRCSGTAKRSAATPREVSHRRPVRTNGKVLTLSEIASCVADHRTKGKSIVFTNGCFDLLHVGHVTFLQEAAELGDVLIVALNDDAGVRRLKGQQRPVIGELDRAAMLASLACVDHVLIFDETTLHHLLDCLRPDVLVKGGTTNEVVGREVVEAYGGRVQTTETAPNTSTTQLVAEIRKTSEITETNRPLRA